jgi:hypothetical protein
MATLKAGQHELVFTRKVNELIAEDSKFAKFVYSSILRFNRGDWGDISDSSKLLNDETVESLNNGGWYGLVQGIYHDQFPNTKRLVFKIWIIRNTGKEDGTQVITVAFPSEY